MAAIPSNTVRSAGAEQATRRCPSRVVPDEVERPQRLPDPRVGNEGRPPGDPVAARIAVGGRSRHTAVGGGRLQERVDARAAAGLRKSHELQRAQRTRLAAMGAGERAVAPR
jgi:hypothetical protein